MLQHEQGFSTAGDESLSAEKEMSQGVVDADNGVVGATCCLQRVACF